MTLTRSSAGSAPRTLRKPKAKRHAAVKSSPTGPREARRKAVPLDGRAPRSYPNHTPPHSPDDWVRRPGRSIKGSETPQLRLEFGQQELFPTTTPATARGTAPTHELDTATTDHTQQTLAPHHQQPRSPSPPPSTPSRGGPAPPMPTSTARTNTAIRR